MCGAADGFFFAFDVPQLFDARRRQRRASANTVFLGTLFFSFHANLVVGGTRSAAARCRATRAARRRAAARLLPLRRRRAVGLRSRSSRPGLSLPILRHPRRPQACSAGGGARGRRARGPGPQAQGARKHKHLLVVDLNGLLVDRRMTPFVEPDGTKRAPDAAFGKFLICNRPHMGEFVAWAFEHFTVGVWSSAQQHNAKTLVSHIWGSTRTSWHSCGGKTSARRRHGPRETAFEAHPPERPAQALGGSLVQAQPDREHAVAGRLAVQSRHEPKYCAIHPSVRVGNRPSCRPTTCSARAARSARTHAARRKRGLVDAFVGVAVAPVREEAPASPREIMRKAREGDAPSPPPRPPRASRAWTRTRSTCRKTRTRRRRRRGDPRRDLDAKDLDEKDLDASGERRRNGGAAEAPDDLDDPDDPDDPDGWGGSGDEGDQLGVADPLEAANATARVARENDDADKKEKKKPVACSTGRARACFSSGGREAGGEIGRRAIRASYEHEMTTRIG